MPAATLSELIMALPEGERAAKKAEVLAKLLKDGSFTAGTKTVSIERFTTGVRDGVTIVVSEAKHENGTFGIVLTASDARGPLPTAPTYWFRNPPIRKWTRAPVTDPDGTVTDPGETSESIVEVIQGIIGDAVIAYALNHGWSP